MPKLWSEENWLQKKFVIIYPEQASRQPTKVMDNTQSMPLSGEETFCMNVTFWRTLLFAMATRKSNLFCHQHQPLAIVLDSTNSQISLGRKWHRHNLMKCLTLLFAPKLTLLQISTIMMNPSLSPSAMPRPKNSRLEGHLFCLDCSELSVKTDQMPCLTGCSKLEIASLLTLRLTLDLAIWENWLLWWLTRFRVAQRRVACSPSSMELWTS